MEDVVTLLEHQADPPLDREAAWSPSELRRVVIRMTDGEILQLGTAPTRDSALVLARTMIAADWSPVLPEIAEMIGMNEASRMTWLRVWSK